MITTILTLLAGFLSSSLPALLRYFEERQKLKYNVQIISLQLEASLRNIEAAKEIEKIKREFKDIDSARDADSNINSGSFANFIRTMVRPLVTFSFVGLYIGVKILVLFVLWNEGFTLVNVKSASDIILDETTIAILATILGFWFGSRVIFNNK